jgi:hypothetical protein
LTQSILTHEIHHLERWKQVGIFKFGFLYLFNKKFRLEEELSAIKIQMKFLKANKEIYNIERKAIQFSGKEYGYMLTYKEAQDILTKM